MEFFQFLPVAHELSAPTVFVAAAIFTRISALIFFLPGLGERVIPLRVRLTAALAIALVLIPVILPTSIGPETVSQGALMIAQQPHQAPVFDRQLPGDACCVLGRGRHW